MSDTTKNEMTSLGVKISAKKRQKISAVSAAAEGNLKPSAPADEPKKPEFRIERKSCGFTWSCPVDEEQNPIRDVQYLLEWFNRYKPPEFYIFAREEHENGKNHFHGYVEWSKKICVKNPHFFDIAGVHPNIISDFRSAKNWGSYCAKDGEYITNLPEGWFSPESVWRRVWQKNDWADAKIILLEEEPRTFLQYGDKFEFNFRKNKKPVVPPIVYNGPFAKGFDVITMETMAENKSFVIRGQAGVGKTQWMRYFMAHNDQPYCYVKGSLQGLKTYNGEPWIVFDDLTIHGEDVMKWNALLDVESGGHIRILYGTVDIPPGVRRIFLTNPECEGGLLLPDIPAIKRRYIEFFIE